MQEIPFITKCLYIDLKNYVDQLRKHINSIGAGYDFNG